MTSTMPISVCWSCRGGVAAGAPFCPTCGAVQPSGDVDHFTRLGLPRSFDLDPAKLDRAYFDWQRKLHPDRFRAKTARERALSQSQAVSLNQAYETLRDPLRRAAYLLELAGHGREGHTVGDPELLMEAMEAREALADAVDMGTVDNLAGANAAARDAALQALGRAFADNGYEAAGRLHLRLTYLAKLAEEIRLRRARLAAAA